MSFTPTQAGQHQVSVNFRGKHLQGSPFNLEVVDRPVKPYSRDYSKVGDQPASQFGSYGAGDGQFQYPCSVMCNSRGEIVVVSDSHHIQVLDRKGKLMFQIGQKGQGNGQFSSPSGVTVDQRNNQIVVADTFNHRIQIFDEKGTFLRVFGSEGNGDGQFDRPHGVVVDQQGHYVVADSWNHRIQIFNSQGQFVRKFGFEGQGNGQMNWPWGVGLLSNGNVVVSEYNGHRLQIFDSRGNFVRIVGAGQVKNPGISLLILMTASWSLTLPTVAFKCSTRMAITSKPLELGRFQTLLEFAWIVREGS